MSKSSSPVLTVGRLCKSYGQTLAVDDVSFELNRNEIVGLLGPNGAGKTTIIGMVLGVLSPTSGTIRIEEVDLAGHRSEALSRVNFAAVYSPLPGNLTVRQNLLVFSMLYAIANPGRRIEELLRQFDLKKFEKIKCGVLSSGEQTRVALAKALLNDPRLLLLDEPTASLDPATAAEIRATIRSVRAQGCGGILWTSHNMHEVEEVCDRVLFLSHGRIILEGDPKILPREHGRKTLEELFIAIAREPLSLDAG